MKTMQTVLLGLLMFVHTVALGDAPELSYGRISITAVNATHANQFETSKLRFTVENDLASVLHLLNVTTPVASTAIMVGRIGAKQTTVFDSTSIPSNGVLDLNTSHLWVELSDLKHALVAGDEFPVELNFGTFIILAIAHVHDDE